MMSRNLRLYRSNRDKMVGGVCGGIAEYLNIDSIIIRLVFILAVFFGGSGVIFYLIAWIIIPLEDEAISYVKREDIQQEGELAVDVNEVEDDEKEVFNRNPDANRSNKILGLVFVIVGMVLLLNTWFPYVNWNKLWPIALIAGGFFLIIKR